MAVDKKETIINSLYNFVKPQNISGTTYNNLLAYAYFHNDICKDLKDLYANYKKMYEDYKKIKDWYDDNRTLISNIDGEHLYTKNGSLDDLSYQGSVINFTTFPSLNNDVDYYENYTYTWDKNYSTYNMPYADMSMPEEISYNPNVKDFGQIISYSYMKWSNNRYEHHTPLIM